MDFSIIMPAFNEEATILAAVQGALDADYGVKDRQVVVIENGSTDQTRAILRAHPWPPEVRIIELDVNRGKGGAVRVGVEQAEGHLVGILDADLEYDPSDYAKMILAMDEGADAVIGVRYWQAHSAYGYWYVKGNQVINTAANVLYNSYLSDCMVGMKLVSRDTFLSLGLKENGFGFDAEWVASLLRRKARIFEVPVQYRARRRAEGKKLKSTDGIRMLRVFVRCRLRKPTKA